MHEIFEQIRWRDHAITLMQLSASIVLLIVSFYYHYDRQLALRIAEANFEAQRYETDTAETMEVVLREHVDDYDNFLKQGFVGTPRRLQWIETLQRLGQDYGLPGLEFTLESSHLAEQGVDPYWHPEVKLLITDLKVVMQLAHEGDLYRLLNGLQREAQGLFSVEGCRMRWLTSFSEEFELARFRSDCQLRWYTVMDGTQAPGVTQ